MVDGLPPGTRIERDIPYGRRPAQRLDLYAPDGAAAAPVLVLVHGGGWVAGDKAGPRVVADKLAHWLPRGWVVVSLNYRTLPWADPRQQAEDVAQALGVVQRHVARFGGDASRMVLLGHSTGAHLAALVLADAALHAGLRPPVGAVLLDSAALDVVQVMQGPHLPLHDRAFGDDAAFWERCSPWHQLQAAVPPLLLVCSTLRDAACAQAERFAARAVELGGRAQVLPVALRHAEINEQLGQGGGLTASVDAFLQSLGLP